VPTCRSKHERTVNQAPPDRGSVTPTKTGKWLESPSPDTPLREKFCRPERPNYHFLDRSLVLVLCLSRPTWFLTLAATDRQPALPSRHERGKGRSRPPGSPDRERLLGASARPAARTDRRAPRGGRTRSTGQQRGLDPRPGSPSARADRREAPPEAVRCGLRCRGRWRL